MAKKEAKTDFWVHGLLQEAGIDLEPQGSSIVEINNALKTASKSGSGNVGFPEFVGVVKDFIGRFYGEFMSYSGGDGQTLGIVLTPRHITDLF